MKGSKRMGFDGPTLPPSRAAAIGHPVSIAYAVRQIRPASMTRSNIGTATVPVPFHAGAPHAKPTP